jgi:HD-GYP domain-containing protein (c-di-GMP phosphodiesterase class II)
MVMVATHPVIASDLVTKIDALARLVPIIKRHHERYDGTGYPDGLKVEEIPLGARVLAVADGFEAMTPSSLIVRPKA